MKIFILLFGLIASLVPNNNPKLTIKISNIQKIQGEIKVGIYTADSIFLKKGAAFKTYSVKVEKNTAVLTITNLPKGEYAVSMFHDENSDDKINKYFIGIPKEPYGFSNNFKPIIAAPKFEDCKFTLSDHQTLNIKLIRWK